MSLNGQAKRSRKWINQRLVELDPEKDYAEIVRLSALYRANDFQLAWFFAVGTPAAGIAPHVLDAVWRGGKSTSKSAPERRRDDSNDHMLTWLEHGPEHAATKISVDMVNKYHSQFARRYRDSFDHVEDYIYILCLNATFVHLASTSLGFSGFTDKQKRATWIFWSKLSDHFTLGTSGERVTALGAFPASFDAMVEVVQSYQARPWPVHNIGHEYTLATTDFFARTWFPRPLRFFGRALISTFLPEGVRRAHAISLPPAPVRVAARAFMKLAMFMADHVLSDPPESLPDRRRRLAEDSGTPLGGVDAAVHQKLVQEMSGPLGDLCPHRQFHKQKA